MKKILFYLLISCALNVSAQECVMNGWRLKAGGAVNPPTANIVSRHLYTQGITQVAGNVSAWTDYSGNLHAATQAVTANQPGIGTGVIFSEANVDVMNLATISLTAPYTIYVICKFAVANGLVAVLGGNGTGGSFGIGIINSGGTRNAFLQGASSGFFQDGTTLSDNTLYCIKVTVNSASSKIRVNNNTATTGTAAGSISAFSYGYTFTSGGGTGNSTILEGFLYTGTGDDAGMEAYVFPTYGVHAN